MVRRYDPSMGMKDRMLKRAGQAPLYGLCSVAALLVGMSLSDSALAHWTLIASTTGYDIYADRFSIQRDGDLASAMYLYDFRAVQSPARGHFRSAKLLREFDCRTRRVRMVAISEYSDYLARGAEVNAFYPELPWEPFTTGGVVDAQWQFACAPD